MTIWDFHKLVTRRLFGINVLNVWIGTKLLKEDNFLYGIGTQSVGWGVINILIAIFGGLGTRQRRAQLPDPHDAAIMQSESRKLKRILLINAGLDVLYMCGGYKLAQTRGEKDAVSRGMGWGIIIQGALLFIFDVIHALIIPSHKKRWR